MPYAPRPEEGRVRHKYVTPTYDAQIVAQYAGISVAEAVDLDIVEFLTLRRDAVISALSESEKGIEYLNDAWAREQTTADRAALRANFA